MCFICMLYYNTRTATQTPNTFGLDGLLANEYQAIIIIIVIIRIQRVTCMKG